MGKPLILIYVGLRNDQSVWTPEWSNIQKIITKILWILPSIQTMRRCVIFLLSEMLTRFVDPNFRHLWVITKTCIIFSSYQQGCRSRGWWALAPQFLADHYGCDTFGPPELVPNWLVPPDKRYPTNSVPIDKWSPKIWSPWTNGPQSIWSLWTNSPQQIWSPYFQIITACPPGQTEYSRYHLSMGTKLVGDHLSMATKFLGTICPWGQKVGDRKSGDQMGSGPNELQPINICSRSSDKKIGMILVNKVL